MKIQILNFSLLAVALTVTLGACSSHISAPSSQMPVANNEASPVTSTAQVGDESFDGDADQALSDGCLQSWRKALKGDEKGAMSQLQELEKRYPKAMTVKFMMGQVEDRAGKRKEATKFYEQAVSQSRYDTMYLFKLAESLRTTGDAKAAIPHYRTLISLNPRFVPAKVGLARALYDVDKKSPEAREQAEQALQLSPDDKDAKALLKSMDQPDASAAQPPKSTS